MNSLIKSLPLAFALGFLAGCAPKEPDAPVAKADDGSAEHMRLFGDEAKAPDITWRKSGLGVRIQNPGTGNLAIPTDIVRVQYIGRLKDGVVFEDSHKNGGPVDFQ